MAHGSGGYRLGIDLGTNSVGWAIVGGNRIIAMGSRIFDAGVQGDIEKGKEEPRNAQRRQARQVRRQSERRARRLRKVYNLLGRHGLLPPAGDPQQRHDLLLQLDATLRSKSPKNRASPHADAQTWLYGLRARGLDEKLEPDELGRALFHLAQRRGFKSGRKAAYTPEEQEDEGKVQAGIETLRERMATAGARTLGEYFSSLDPTEREQRIRGLWTARDMYAHEFDEICKAQNAHQPELLSDALVADLREAMFFQRPLKKVLPGRCELEPDQRRAPLAHPAAQRIRMIQAVNNLALRPALGRDIDLTQDQRNAILHMLEAHGDVTMARARRLIGVGNKMKFNLEEGGEKRLVGDRTAQHMRQAIGELWDSLTPSRQERIVTELLEADDDIPALSLGLAQRWGLERDQALALARTKLEPGYAALSLKAIRKLSPCVEAGERFGAARAKVYGASAHAGPAVDLLPPVRRHRGVREDDVFAALRNPAVERSLAELRKVVNCLLRKYGKPDRVHVEVARDLKNPRDLRARLNKRRLDNEKTRAKAFAQIQKETGNPRPNRKEIEAYLLWEECGGFCPYTGFSISLRDLFGPEPQFEVEHIIPRSRSLDDSFNNKTLCHRDANRDKRNKTPWEAFGSDPVRWEEILQRVRRFKGLSARSKLSRFESPEVQLDDFTERQLNDTRYASKLAGDYLGLLFGGRVDPGNKKRVQVSAGGLTARLRAEWGLNGLLDDGDTKNGGRDIKTRDDHRHHAVDALVIALTEERTIQQMARAAERAEEQHRRRLDLAAPWPNFVQHVREAVDQIVVSHRVDRRVQAKIHDDTLYSKAYQRTRKGKPVEMRRVRKPLENMSPKEIGSIVDPAVRAAVAAKLEELGGDVKKFHDPSNLPSLPNKKGGRTPIRSARIERAQSVQTIGKGPRERHVALAANHHLEVYANLDDDGDEMRWQGRLVSMYEAMARVRARKIGSDVAVVEKDHGKRTKFKFSLAPGETIELQEPQGEPRLYIVRSISQERTSGGRRPAPIVEFVDVRDARLKKDIKTANAWGKRAVNPLGELGCRKVLVSPVGEVFPAHD
ncbi:MAG: type II CRISPR RNA-guided endonuclease Cas9 [Acidobacteria bacterium]|nr:type II CRISPR RNA-guided endonuclease Cas9 [Acidobacteriota bacterium]